MKKVFLIFLLLSQSAFADDLFMSSVQNGCSSGLNNDTYLWATFTRNQYQCNSGYYLPANTDHCVVCPEYYNCDGGTFAFNENIDQGKTFKTQVSGNILNGCKSDFLMVANNVANITATFVPNIHTCNAGYFLPANVDECTICPTNSICSGGTYSFNETTDQGIVACSSGTFSPTGSAVCYPHILHVGDSNVYLKSTKQTTPSLNIKIGNDVFYANMTTTRTRMSKDSSHYLHIKTADNVHYYVCDDTTCPSE